MVEQINPFFHRLHLTWLDIFYLSVTGPLLVPIRLSLVLVITLFTWLVGRVGLTGLTTNKLASVPLVLIYWQLDSNISPPSFQDLLDRKASTKTGCSNPGVWSSHLLAGPPGCGPLQIFSSDQRGAEEEPCHSCLWSSDTGYICWQVWGNLLMHYSTDIFFKTQCREQTKSHFYYH